MVFGRSGRAVRVDGGTGGPNASAITQEERQWVVIRPDTETEMSTDTDADADADADKTTNGAFHS